MPCAFFFAFFLKRRRNMVSPARALESDRIPRFVSQCLSLCKWKEVISSSQSQIPHVPTGVDCVMSEHPLCPPHQAPSCSAPVAGWKALLRRAVLAKWPLRSCKRECKWHVPLLRRSFKSHRRIQHLCLPSASSGPNSSCSSDTSQADKGAWSSALRAPEPGSPLRHCQRALDLWAALFSQS